MARKGSKQLSTADQAFSNQEVVTLAVYLLGGASRPVDTEDIAIKANEIAPGRFTWRKYPLQINIETVRKRLWDATRTDRLGFLAGTERVGWNLTRKGLRFAEALASKSILPDLSKERLSLKERRWRAAERRRLVSSDAYAVCQRSGAAAVSQRQAEAFFRLDDYVLGRMRDRKIDRVLNAFAGDPELGSVVAPLAAKVKGPDPK